VVHRFTLDPESKQVEDLLKWVQLMLNKGVYNNDTIFSPTQYYTLTAPHTLMNAGKAETPNKTPIFMRKIYIEALMYIYG